MKKQKRIVAFNWTDIKHPLAGGAEYMTHQHFKHWVKNGYEVIQITSWYPGLAKEEAIDGVKTFRRSNRNNLWAFGWYYFFKLCQGKADLIIDQFHGMPYFSPLWSSSPKIALINEVPDIIWDKLYPPPLSWIGKFLDWFNLLFYRRIPFWTISPSTASDLIKYGINKNNIKVIYCGDNLPTLPKPIEKYPILTLLSVNRLSKMKGIEDIIDAFNLVVKETPSAKLVVIGRGTAGYETYLKAKVEKLGIQDAVNFTGYVDEVSKIAFYQKSHFLLHASVKEGWGLNVIEANSQGTPAVVYNVSGLRDSVKDGLSGVICKQNTSEELAFQTLKLWRDKQAYQKLQLSALEYSKTYSWEKATREGLEMVRKYLKD